MSRSVAGGLWRRHPLWRSGRCERGRCNVRGCFHLWVCSRRMGDIGVESLHNLKGWVGQVVPTVEVEHLPAVSNLIVISFPWSGMVGLITQRVREVTQVPRIFYTRI